MFIFGQKLTFSGNFCFWAATNVLRKRLFLADTNVIRKRLFVAETNVFRNVCFWAETLFFFRKHLLHGQKLTLSGNVCFWAETNLVRDRWILGRNQPYPETFVGGQKLKFSETFVSGQPEKKHFRFLPKKQTLPKNVSFRPKQTFPKVCFPRTFVSLHEINFSQKPEFSGTCEAYFTQKPEFNGKLTFAVNHSFRPQRSFHEKVCFPLTKQTFPGNLSSAWETNVSQKGYSLTK